MMHTSFEFFPPKTDEQRATLEAALPKLKALDPDYVSVTFGAGGSTLSYTPETVRHLRQDHGLDAAPHLSCMGGTREEIFRLLELYKAMGCKRSKVPWVVLAVGRSGSTFMLWFESFAMGNLYPMVVGGKPLFSLPAFVPIWYEITVLSSCITAFLANWILCGLPRPNHPAFNSKAFERVTDDKFFILIEADDPKFDAAATKSLLQATHPSLVEEIPR